MPLYGWTWIQDEWPADPQPLQELRRPTSGEIYFRNRANTEWVFHSYIDEEHGGAVMRSGSVLTGPLEWNHGHPPSHDPNFGGTVRQEGLPMATLRALAEMERRMLSRLSTDVRRMIATQTQLSETAKSICLGVKTGLYSYDTLKSTGHVIDLPVFKSDNIAATEDQILGYWWSIYKLQYTDRDPGSAQDMTAFHLEETAPGSRIIKANATVKADFAFSAVADRYGVISWIMAVR